MEGAVLKFLDTVIVKRGACKSCYSFIYRLPCTVDKTIIEFMTSFGKPLYPLKTVKLLKIFADDGFRIEGRVGQRIIKFYLPKSVKGTNIKNNERKIEFENNLADWISDRINILVLTEQQETTHD